MAEIVSPDIEQYCLQHTDPPSALLEEIAAYTRAHVPDAQMMIGPLQAALLKLLVRTSGARRVLEIGTFTGYSALAMAEALPADGALVTCEKDAARAEIAQGFFRRSLHGGRIALKLGPALDTIAALPAEPAFDLVFIDADKENYVNYYEAVLPRVRAGGLIVADNVLWYGRVLAPKEASDRAIVAFNRKVAEDPRVEAVMLPLRDGVYVIRKY